MVSPAFITVLLFETAAADMEYIARQAHYAKDDTDPVFHYILSWQSHAARVRNRFMTVYVIR